MQNNYTQLVVTPLAYQVCRVPFPVIKIRHINAARRRRSQRGQRCLALSLCQELEKYIFQDFFLPRFCYAAGKFCKVFPAKKTGGRAAGKMHGQLFPGQKTDRLPANNGEKARLIRRPMCKKDRRATRKHVGSADLFCNYQKEYCAKYRQTKQKTSAFLSRFNTRKDPVFSDRVLVVAGTGLEPATSGL